MGQSSSSNRHSRDVEFEQPSPYASAIARKKPILVEKIPLNDANGGLRRSIRHDMNAGMAGLENANQHHSSSTASSTQKSSTSTVSSTSGGGGGTRYIPNMKKSKGLTMPRGGAPLHSGQIAAAPSSDTPNSTNGGYTSPDAWGFHINITPTQEVYAANVGGTASSLDPKRRQNQVFKNLQNANTTNMGWTSVPI